MKMKKQTEEVAGKKVLRLNKLDKKKLLKELVIPFWLYSGQLMVQCHFRRRNSPFRLLTMSI